jgi:hypothetical protein
MQYTLRRIPLAVDRALRDRAARSKKSLNEVAIDALVHGLGLDNSQVKHRKLGHLAGHWIKDDAVDRALADQRAIDPELWR